MGFLLIYFQPAFYCNVSDAWLIAEKSKRLWVTISGPYLEIFLWALAVIIWRVTEPGTWPSAVALVVVATSALRLFINLNPLIKLDGYYLLSDALGIHNLRARAFGYLKRRLSALVGLVVDGGWQRWAACSAWGSCREWLSRCWGQIDGRVRAVLRFARGLGALFLATREITVSGEEARGQDEGEEQDNPHPSID